MTNPQGIPYGIAMERAFWRFADEQRNGEQAFQEQLRATIPVTNNDMVRIGEIASRSYSFAATARNEASEKFDQLCAELLKAPTGTLNALDVAQRLSGITDSEAERLTMYYKDAVGGLSPSARSALETYVDTNIRGDLTWGQDLVGLASEVPQAFLSHRERSCELRLRKPASEKAWKRSIHDIVVDTPKD